MSSLFKVGQVLKGRASHYTITKEIRNSVWFAKNQMEELAVIKSIQDYPHVQNERDLLKVYQHRTPYLRPLIDEIDVPAAPIAIALKYFDTDLLRATLKKGLNRKELKYMSRCVLEALKTLHEDGVVHTDVKPDNVFVNLQEGDMRFSDVRLGDLGGGSRADSQRATSGTITGAPIWTAPEILMGIPWNNAADIWSFGTMFINVILGGNANIFRPRNVEFGHENYESEVFEELVKYFGPFPDKFMEISDREKFGLIKYIEEDLLEGKRTPFSRVTTEQVCTKDNIFISKMMKVDWRDRPTAEELLEDEWWNDD